MKILILGANGMLGPYVVKALEDKHTLRLTDIDETSEMTHEYRQVDVSDLNAVNEVAYDMDVIVNLSVLRHDRKLAFDVNARGCYNVMNAAVLNGIERVINTGPHFTIAGPTFEEFDFAINPEIPSQSGTGLYAHTKSLGQEICRVFSENHDIYVLTLLFYNFREPDVPKALPDISHFVPFSVTWTDAGNAFASAVEVDKEILPSRCEIFNVFADLPHGQFTNDKTREILDWQPTNNLDKYWRRSQGD